MHLALKDYVLLSFACIPFIYYFLTLYSCWRFFKRSKPAPAALDTFVPPISNLKPIRGLDPDAYENFASFCRQDYPEYEVVFCVDSTDDAALSVIDRLKQDFPDCNIRVLFGSGRIATNDKVAKLARLVNEAAYEHLVISDSDVRVRPDYLRKVIAPLANSKIGAVTCLYVGTGETSFAENLQTVGMISDFYAGLLVARELDGVKFALGPTIATTRSKLTEFGGYQKIENQPADDLLVGRLIAEQGYEIEISAYTVETVSDYQSMQELLHKRMRWLVVMRHMRPWGHLGLMLTQGLPWCLLAIALYPTAAVVIPYLGTYLALRLAMAWSIGAWGLRQPVGAKLLLFPAWDALAFALWITSFLKNTVRWRGGDYHIREGMLVPAASNSAGG